MQELINRLSELEIISSGLEPNAEKRKELLNVLNEYTEAFIEDIDNGKSYFQNDQAINGLEIDGKAHSLKEVLKNFDREVTHRGINPASGGHVGYIPGGGIYTAALADYLADVTNEYSGMYFGSPGAVAIEHEVLNWLKKVFGFPESSIGNLPSGGSIANLIALTAARDHHEVKGTKVERAVIYLSQQVHHCVQKALRIIGLGDVIIRYISLDDGFRLKAEELQQQIEIDKSNDLKPFLVIASAGTTDTGAVDPLNDIADIAQSENLWFHVDAAYGGFFILCAETKHLFQGIERADSLVVDPHKGMFLPYGVGAVLVKNRKAILHSHHYVANYMQDTYLSDTPLNPADVSPELTKHFRALRVWLPLQLHGIDPFIACLDEKLVLTHYFRARLMKEGFEVGPEPDLSVSYFWYPQKEKENEFNKRLMELIHEDGRVFLSSTTINGRFVIRMAILSFRTKKHTIDTAMEMIVGAVKRVMDHGF